MERNHEIEELKNENLRLNQLIEHIEKSKSNRLNITRMKEILYQEVNDFLKSVYISGGNIDNIVKRIMEEAIDNKK